MVDIQRDSGTGGWEGNVESNLKFWVHRFVLLYLSLFQHLLGLAVARASFHVMAPTRTDCHKVGDAPPPRIALDYLVNLFIFISLRLLDRPDKEGFVGREAAFFAALLSNSRKWLGPRLTPSDGVSVVRESRQPATKSSIQNDEAHQHL